MNRGARRFEKWEGLGNDFILVEATPTIDQVRALCDRRRGVGADGVLVVGLEPPSMIVFNADGSRPEMCGNGVRCVAAYLRERGAGPELVVSTDAGERACRVEAEGSITMVTVDMGRVRFGPDLAIAHDGATRTFFRAEIGNPHAITFDEIDAASRAEVGSLVERSVPGGTNVEFVELGPDELDVVVWERGVGFTDACGTGACATAAVACGTGRAAFGAPLRVRLPGGVLRIVVEAGAPAETGPVSMRGPATHVFSGTW